MGSVVYNETQAPNFVAPPSPSIAIEAPPTPEPAPAAPPVATQYIEVEVPVYVPILATETNIYAGIYASARAYEIEALVKCVYFESGNQPLEGKMAVANVVLNRVLTNYGGRDVSIATALNHPGQFSTLGSIRRHSYEWVLSQPGGRDCLFATEVVLRLGYQAVPSDYTYFRTGSPHKSGRRDAPIKIGGHYFT